MPAQREYKPHDNVFALTENPGLALSLTFDGTRWSTTVFDFTQKKAVLTEQSTTLEEGKRTLESFVKSTYGIDPQKISWREAMVLRDSTRG